MPCSIRFPHSPLCMCSALPVMNLHAWPWQTVTAGAWRDAAALLYFPRAAGIPPNPTPQPPFAAIVPLCDASKLPTTYLLLSLILPFLPIRGGRQDNGQGRDEKAYRLAWRTWQHGCMDDGDVIVVVRRFIPPYHCAAVDGLTLLT